MAQKNKQKTNTVEVSNLDDIRHKERLAIISEELINMKPKKKIIEEYSKKWNCLPHTVRTLIKETIVWLSTEAHIEREEMRVLNSERLENLFDTKGATVKDKIKIIDILNKTHNIYSTDVNVAVKDDIIIDIGV